MSNSAPNAPYAWAGSRAEWSVYWALTEIGLKPNYDFIYQAPQNKESPEHGGAVIDFLFPDSSRVINLWNEYDGRPHRALVKEMAKKWGLTIAYINEEDAIREPLFFVKEALK